MRTEIRWASFMLSYCSLVYVMTGALLDSSASQFSGLLEWYEVDDTWLVVQAVSSALLAVGAIMPRRSSLHIGLVLSGLAWAAITLTLIGDLELSPVALLFPFFGFMSFALLIDDVYGRTHRARLA
jgi:hypothetical protein